MISFPWAHNKDQKYARQMGIFSMIFCCQLLTKRNLPVPVHPHRRKKNILPEALAGHDPPLLHLVERMRCPIDTWKHEKTHKRQVWTSFDKIGQYLTSFDYFGQVCTNLNNGGSCTVRASWRIFLSFQFRCTHTGGRKIFFKKLLPCMILNCFTLLRGWCAQ